MRQNTLYLALPVIFLALLVGFVDYGTDPQQDYYAGGTTVGTRGGLNVIAGDGLTVSGADNAADDRVDLTLDTDAETGTATVTAGNTTVDVTHGLGATPARVFLSPTTDTLGARWWVSAKTATTFTISLHTNQASDVSFDWRAQAEE